MTELDKERLAWLEKTCIESDNFVLNVRKILKNQTNLSDAELVDKLRSLFGLIPRNISALVDIKQDKVIDKGIVTGC
jgi:hypothetical protein